MGIDTIVFDWSGVISDDRKPVWRANVGLLRHFGKKELSYEEWLACASMSDVSFCREHGIDADQYEIHALYQELFTKEVKSGNKPIIYGDVIPVVRALRMLDVPLAILSSHPTENLQQELFENRIEGCFSAFIGSSRDKVSGLARLAQYFRINIDRILFCGDTTGDINAAIISGAQSGAMAGYNGMQRGYHNREKLTSLNPDYVLESFTELLGLPINHRRSIPSLTNL